VIEELVKQIESRFAELGEQMTDPDVISDRERYAQTGRDYSQIEPAAKLAGEWRRAQDDATGAQELIAEMGEDAELRADLEVARARIEELEEEIRLAMVERDPNDEKSVIVEIQGGAGGEEAGLWAGDLYRMLTRYAESRGWQTEPMEVGDGKYTFAVKGDGAYSVFKFEGGTHRVQRVPATESQGRIHTSTATVAVLPEAEDVDVQVEPNDLQIDVYRSSGPGGQSVNTTDSAVRVTHRPTGIVVSMQDEKSQLQNREKALRVLRARLFERAQAEQQAELAADRRSQVGTGDRAEKIRTYNYGERRVTDHRIKVTVHNLDQVLEGSLDELTAALQADEKRRRLEGPAAARGMSAAREAAGAHTVSDALQGAITAITAAGAQTPRLDAEVMLAHVLGVGREQLIMDPSLRIQGPAVRAYQDAVRRRSVGREPVAYIVGERGFRHLQIAVDSRALIPRPESELLVEAALELPEGSRVIDLCTGSGAVALAVKDERPDLDVHASDISPRALDLARENAARLGLDVTWHEADLLAGIPDQFDAVLANPPYVSERERSALEPEILRHEPPQALFAGEDGLSVIRPLIAALGRRGGIVLAAVEFGQGQGRDVAALARDAGFAEVRLERDLAGIERMMLARRRTA
jgi:peptide chain release factor 1